MTRPHTAFRFDVPALEGGGQEPGGFALTTTGKLQMIDGAASVRQAILLLLSTEPGERVMRPTYGCSLEHLVFSPNDETTAGLVIHYVRRALETWEPRIDILDLDAGPNPEQPEILEISLRYRLKASGWVDQLRLPFSLQGART